MRACITRLQIRATEVSVGITNAALYFYITACRTIITEVTPNVSGSAAGLQIHIRVFTN